MTMWRTQLAQNCKKGDAQAGFHGSAAIWKSYGNKFVWNFRAFPLFCQIPVRLGSYVDIHIYTCTYTYIWSTHNHTHVYTCAYIYTHIHVLTPIPVSIYKNAHRAKSIYHHSRVNSVRNIQCLTPRRWHRLIICVKKCPWSNSYRHMKWTRRHEFKSWTSVPYSQLTLCAK